MPRNLTRPRWAGAIALAGWVMLVAAAVVWGRHLLPGGRLALVAPPFQGHYRFLPSAVVPGAVVAVVVALVLPALSPRLAWRALLPLCVALAACWAVALAVWDGHAALSSPIDRGPEYLPLVAVVGNDPAGFLATFADEVARLRYPVHVTGHPPLMVLVFWAWDHVAPGPGWAAALVIAAGASSVAAIAVVVRALGDEPAARRALPFLVLGPFAVTVATSADAFFLGVAAWGAAALATGLRRGSWPLLAGAGLLLGSLPFLSYGLLPFGSVLLAVVWLAVRRHGWPGRSGAHRAGLAAAFVLGLLVVPAVLTAGGFWWFDGVAATHAAWRHGKGDDRPYGYSFLGDLAVLAVLTGPATAVAAARRPGRVPGVLAAAALLSLLVLTTSGITRLETERIWLPFAPWLVLLTSTLARGSRGWLLLNASCALAFQLLVYDVW